MTSFIGCEKGVGCSRYIANELTPECLTMKHQKITKMMSLEVYY